MLREASGPTILPNTLSCRSTTRAPGRCPFAQVVELRAECAEGHTSRGVEASLLPRLRVEEVPYWHQQGPSNRGSRSTSDPPRNRVEPFLDQAEPRRALGSSLGLSLVCMVSIRFLATQGGLTMYRVGSRTCHRSHLSVAGVSCFVSDRRSRTARTTFPMEHMRANRAHR